MTKLLLAVALLAAAPSVAVPATGTVPASEAPRVAELLRANGGDSARADTVADAVVEYARLHDINPLLIVGIIGVENAELRTRAASYASAVGIMQVHAPTWRGKFAQTCGPDLLDIRTNICYGVRILAMNLSETKTLRAALLRYNGCRGAASCVNYPTMVEARIGRAVMRVEGIQ